MRARQRDLLLGAGLAGLLLVAVLAATSVTSRAVNELLRQDAEAAGEAWARYLAGNVGDLDAIVAGAQPSAESMAFFERAQKVGNVFLYKIFDANGGLRLSSDKLDQIGKTEGSIPAHNPEAAEIVLKGETEVEAKEGQPPNRPSFYSEAYVPVVIGGRVLGIVEAYVDQSEKRAAFHARINRVALSLAAVIAVAFGLPAVGFYWRTRQKRHADSRVEFLADHDPLTGLLNRTRFMRDLDEALALGCSVAVHHIDIDRFKEINDTLGHEAGDEILRQAARRLQALSRKRDLLARLGSDDFALAQIVEGARQVTVTGRQIAGALGESYRFGDQELAGSASVGSAIAPVHGKDAATLLKSAEIALSHSKADGPGTRSQFRPEMDVELKARRELETRLRRAVAGNGFDLHFQPIFRAADMRLSGFEALLRLPDDGGGQVSPAVFVPLAERLGLISAIGDWVIRRACEIAATWPAELSVAVNLSPAQFQDGRLANTVQDALTAAGIAAERLELEITEGLLLSDSDWIMRQLAELKGLGVRIAMDDFGTGYSSLSYLWKFPFDKLKIDQSFVRALDRDDQHLASVIGAIVALGGSLGMTITAEGVETGQQLDLLRRFGCHQLQGFFLGRPMPLDQVGGAIFQDFRSALPREEDAVAIGTAQQA